MADRVRTVPRTRIRRALGMGGPWRLALGLGLMAVSLVPALLALLAQADPAFATQYPQTSLEPKSEVGWMVQRLLESIVFWCVVIFVVVEAALIVAVLKFRRRPGLPEPKHVHGNTALEVAWTIAPAIILAFIAVPTVKTIFATATVPASALEVKVIGHQWWWEFRYPQLGITTANELAIPTGKAVSLSLETVDVIHSFWIPAFAGKRDVIPTRTNHLWFTADSTGTYPGQCAEYCGTSHANMHFQVMAMTEAGFDAWVAQQKAPASSIDTTSLAAKGLTIYKAGLCVACHTIDGVSVGSIGPSLNKVALRSTIASGMFPNDTEHMKRWIRNAPALKPGSLMPNMNLTDEQAEALVAYLQTRR